LTGVTAALERTAALTPVPQAAVAAAAITAAVKVAAKEPRPVSMPQQIAAAVVVVVLQAGRPILAAAAALANMWNLSSHRLGRLLS
jgi:uncharacterized membrane protein YjjP (DUF1212 family)